MATTIIIQNKEQQNITTADKLSYHLSLAAEEKITGQVRIYWVRSNVKGEYSKINNIIIRVLRTYTCNAATYKLVLCSGCGDNTRLVSDTDVHGLRCER